MTRSPRPLGPLLAAAALIVLSAAPSARASDWGDASIRLAAHSFDALERKDIETLSRALDTLVADRALIDAYRARDRAGLLALAQPRFQQLKAELHVTHWYFLDPEPVPTCFLRVHAPETHDDVVRRDTLAKAIATHGMGAGKELGVTAFALRVVKPIRDGDAVVGYMELGEEIDHFLVRMKEQTGDDYTLVVDKQHVDRKELARVRGQDRWDERPEVVLVDSTCPSARPMSIGVPLAKLPARGRVTGEWSEGKLRYVGGAFPVLNAGGHVVGALLVRHHVHPR
ncbi:hypothetical protein AMOR_02400 [Anaeromyxobacter oryzae]|uniref:Double Cache domain-containing protein n=1 Tax=Anaeromyxobacter oryzae TaxID=2918170 RepID=A0ABM7WP63_9BACT|nr:cache domain-containing protein [Anaeromyxobacter oryzae]BDG01244.1 hypothetical protein AMOR_02400 [Anaeromyxobacter oryzae]